MNLLESNTFFSLFFSRLVAIEIELLLPQQYRDGRHPAYVANDALTGYAGLRSMVATVGGRGNSVAYLTDGMDNATQTLCTHDITAHTEIKTKATKDVSELLKHYYVCFV